MPPGMAGGALRQAGFSLMELMVAVGILGILSAVGTPLVMKSIPNYRLRSAARELVADFQTAKIEAVRRNAEVVIEFSPGAFAEAGGIGGYTMFIDDGAGGGTAGDGELNGEEIALKSVAMPRFVTLSRASFSGSTKSAGYNSRGLSWNRREGNVQIRTGSLYYKVTLTAAGNARLERSRDGSSWK